MLANGQPVRDADTWFMRRRPEILKLYETEIYDRVLANAPKVRSEVTGIEANGPVILKHVTGYVASRVD